MASSARIEELRKKFDENPRRYFAPLANEYRKAGDVEQAIALCRAHLPQQPGHMSGHIVFGQALYEQGDLDEAHTVFETALALDPENLIALRHLGDIAHAREDVHAARQWYQRVLDADPRNEEISALLDTLDGPAPAWPTPAETIAVDGTMESRVDADSILDPDDVDLGMDSGASAEPQRTEPQPSERATTNAMAAMGVDADAPLDESFDLDVDGFAASMSDTADRATAQPDATEQEHDAPVSAEFELGGFAELSPSEVVPVAPANDGFSPDQLDSFVELSEDAGSVEFTAPLPDLESVEFVAPPRVVAPPADASGARQPADLAPGTRPAAFVTETMAELYLQQGFRQEALDVYRQLLAADPHDETLRERVAELEAGTEASPRVGAAADMAWAPSPSDGAATGRTIQALFAAVVARRVPGRTAADHTDRSAELPPVGLDAAPAASAAVDEGVHRAEPYAAPPPAEDYFEATSAIFVESSVAVEPEDAPRYEAELTDEVQEPSAPATLDALFGAPAVGEPDEAAASMLSGFYVDAPANADAPTEQTAEPGGQATRPASTELSLDHVFRDTPRRSDAAAQAASFSFDQFFAGTTGGGNGSAEAPAPADDSRDDEAHDIEQFNAWLEGLKKK